MELIQTDSKDVRPRVHLRAEDMDGDEIIAYEDVDKLPQNAADRIRQNLEGHPLKKYPEGAYIGSLSPPGLESMYIRKPETIISKPYPHDLELSEFPPEEDMLYKW